MAPEGQDAFYVLVPVPNNLSNINWSNEGEKFKNLVLDKMDKSVLPGIKKNVVSDFYLTPDYFEKDLSTLHGSDFQYNQSFLNLLILGFIINQKFLIICFLLGQERIQVLECQV